MITGCAYYNRFNYITMFSSSFIISRSKQMPYKCYWYMYMTFLKIIYLSSCNWSQNWIIMYPYGIFLNLSFQSFLNIYDHLFVGVCMRSCVFVHVWANVNIKIWKRVHIDCKYCHILHRKTKTETFCSMWT